MLISIRLKINNDSKSQSFIVERMEDVIIIKTANQLRY
jgi:hypothetical protein